MKVYIEKEGYDEKKRRNTYRTVVQQGHQYFTIVESRPKKEAEWYVKMFQIALNNHDEERDADHAFGRRA